MAPPNEAAYIRYSLLLDLSTSKDERLSWPSWLAYSRRLNHISGHPSAAGRAWNRESSPVKDQRSNHCATQPTVDRGVWLVADTSKSVIEQLLAVELENRRLQDELVCLHETNTEMLQLNTAHDNDSSWYHCLPCLFTSHFFDP